MTAETLPASMLARLVWLGAALLEVARRNRDATLEVLEQEVLERVRAAQGGLLEEVVGQATSALAPSQQRVRLACPQCGQRAKVRDWRARRVQTICGGLGFERPWYHCAACQHHRPDDGDDDHDDRADGVGDADQRPWHEIEQEVHEHQAAERRQHEDNQSPVLNDARLRDEERRRREQEDREQ